MTTKGPSNGTLIIHGGSSCGRPDQETLDRFIASAGGPRAKFVYIPTAEEAGKIIVKHGDAGQFHGLACTVLHTRDRAEADVEGFTDLIRNANGVFIEGGRQSRLAEAYLDTQTQIELEKLLDRGGVIAGTSAGATILGSFLVRNQGAPDYDHTVMVDPNHPTQGFGFIKNVAIDQHVSARGREDDLVEVISAHPELLGIGIDEMTAIEVRGDRFTVIGDGAVYIHDGVVPWYRLEHGAEFDLMNRKRLP